MRTRLFVAAAACLAAVAAGAGVAGAAPAPSSVALGGGSGILLPDVDHSDPDRVAACTLTAVGYDNAGSLVALTAGHCGVVGDRVFAEYLPEMRHSRLARKAVAASSTAPAAPRLWPRTPLLDDTAR